MIHSLRRLKRATRRLAGLSGRHRGVVLLYHRAAAGLSDPWSLSVTPRRFAEHVDVLRRHAHAARLVDVVRNDPRATSDRAVAVTFDDGYADNFRAAKPLLERFDIPCTFFLVSGHI